MRAYGAETEASDVVANWVTSGTFMEGSSMLDQPRKPMTVKEQKRKRAMVAFQWQALKRMRAHKRIKVKSISKNFELGTHSSSIAVSLGSLPTGK
jgi:hypothetical protein